MPCLGACLNEENSMLVGILLSFLENQGKRKQQRGKKREREGPRMMKGRKERRQRHAHLASCQCTYLEERKRMTRPPPLLDRKAYSIQVSYIQVYPYVCSLPGWHLQTRGHARTEKTREELWQQQEKNREKQPPLPQSTGRTAWTKSLQSELEATSTQSTCYMCFTCFV